MPSFRAQLPVHDVRPGHRPPEVLGAARDAVPGFAHCDDVRLDLPRGVPIVTVRFSIRPGSGKDEDARARACGDEIRNRLEAVAVVSPPRMHRRRGGGWLALLR
ncbi:hypothetical protein [uncultured Propionibacterium sp.]|uniref:hypothetical protein n=1 Tax=uncultured Propionibacterium sp. TaxID=218066 RepID=UPI00292F9D79|nr:hypothetical protein [uncultured Propionibacterium sp.]